MVEGENNDKKEVGRTPPPAKTKPVGPAAGTKELTPEEERRRRIILALWLLMFSILTGVFVFIFFNLFGGQRGEGPGRRCLDCHDKEMTRQLAAQYKHEPFERERCTECHRNIVCDKKKGEFAVIKGSMQTLCFGCHSKTKSQQSKKVVHKPFKGKRCTDCHDPHASQFTKLTVLPSNELCVSCHYGRDFTQVFQHQPAQARNCIDCHEPHSSDEMKHLTMSVGDLCYSCHLRVAQQVYRPFKHDPFVKEDCLVCHRPHSSVEKKLLPKAFNSLCESCHPAIGVDFTRVAHHPLGSEVMPNCGKCHLYHAADYPKLLPLSNTVNCYQANCHPGLQEQFDVSEHNSSVMGMLSMKNFAVNCSACHSPHGSDFSRMLTQSKYTVCLICHAEQAGHTGFFAHAANPPTLDPWHGDYMWCGSCHAFHGSPFPQMRSAQGDDLCLKCHSSSELENTDR